MKAILVKAQVKIHMVPNFLILEDGQKIPVCAVPEEGLEEIGREWTLALINRGRQQQTEPSE